MPESEDHAAERPTNGGSGRSVRLGAIVALAAAAGLVAWVLLDRSGESSASDPPPAAVGPSLPSTPAETITRPTIQTTQELRTIATVGTLPLYWAGPRAGMKIEFSRTTGGTTFVRYLPTGTRAGDPEPRLTVATYARPDGFADVQAASTNDGAESLQLDGGGLGVFDPSMPTNVHFAYPGEAYQVEVFSPDEGVALRLVANGKVRPVR